MCLYKTHLLPKFSFKKKVIYKVVAEYSDLSWKTPFLRTKIKEGMVLKASQNWLFNPFLYFVNGEGVHGYLTYKRAVEEKERLDRFFFTRDSHFNLNFNFIVIQCEIPSFTFYWNGLKGEIAATKMIIKDKVKYI